MAYIAKTNWTNNEIVEAADLNRIEQGIENSVEKVAGKGLSTNDYTTAEKNKLAGIAAQATKNDTDANLRNRATHTGTQSADTIVDGTTNKVFTATEKTKLAGIATGATKNSTDATLLSRANHTGTQSADTITDGTTNKVFTAAEKTKLANIEDGANKYTHPTTAGNKHIPAGGASGQILRYSASGTAVWGDESVTPVVDNLTSTSTTSALSANQGRELAEQIGTISGKRTARFVIGTSTAGWTSADCDYLCDGTADQAEINAAITALPATGGEIVILDGTYNITAKINVTKDNVSIRGNGNATILKRMYDSTSYEGVITLTSRSGCKIANLQVDGNKASFTSTYNRGIILNSSSNNTITGNTCNNNHNGINVSSSSNNTVNGNTCNNNNDRGIYLYSSSNNTITGNTCNTNTNTGILLTSSSNNTVTGNTCNSNTIYGIRLDSSSSNNTITGNTCNNNDRGIYLYSSSSNNTITGNTCIRGTGLSTDYTASQYTIQLAGTDNNYNLISNNNCMGKAVTVGGGTGNSVWGNKFDNTDDLSRNYMPIVGGTFTGVAIAQSNTSYTTRQIRNFVLSTSDPSGGSNGDVWIKYT
jgi:parallel beta-helix repeat protein